MIKVIIGQTTIVSLGDGEICALSANWGFDPGKQDAFCLNSWLPNPQYMVYKQQQTLSITLYAPGPTHSVAPSESCDAPGTIAASVAPGYCDGAGATIGGDWMVTSYNYSKESKDQPAQESWSLIKYTGITGYLSTEAAERAVEPSVVLRGIAQGQTTNEIITGIKFNGSAFATSNNGSVSAGAIGKETTMEHGIVSEVGGGSSTATDQGTGSASIPLNPIYQDIS